MRYMDLIATVLLGAAMVSPAWSQSNHLLETSRDAERRRQAEQYYYEKEQQRRGNELNTEKPRGLGEAPPASNLRGRPDSYDPSRPRECPPNNYIC